MKPCWCILPCPCRQPQSAEPESNAYSLRNSQARAVAAVNVAGGNIAAPKSPTLEEQHKAADAALYDAREEATRRLHAVGLAVKASDGARDDLLALAPLFEAWGNARKNAQVALDHREAIGRAMKEAKSNG